MKDFFQIRLLTILLFDLTPDPCAPFYLPSQSSSSSSSSSSHRGLKELELYKEELVSKPALLVVNKMDLPDAEDKLAELKEQLQNPDGKFDVFFTILFNSFIFFKFSWIYDANEMMYSKVDFPSALQHL